MEALLDESRKKVLKLSMALTESRAAYQMQASGRHASRRGNGPRLGVRGR